MTEPRRWRKSSRSQNTESCVELPNTMDSVCDSKNGATLPGVVNIVALLDNIKAGRFNL